MSHQHRNLNISLSAFHFFKAEVTEAIKAQQLKVDPGVEEYLAHMLERFLSVEQLFPTHAQSGKAQNQLLAEMFLRALNQTHANQKVQLYQRLGETALYVSGFFGDSLKRKLVNLEYYVNMGTNAYSWLAEHFDHEKNSQIYSSVAEKFIGCVDVLSYISHKSFVHKAEDVLNLYDKYLQTGSRMAQDLLHKKGLVLIPKQKTKVQ